MTRLISIFITIFFSCGSSKTKNSDSIIFDSTLSNRGKEIFTVHSDTLRNPSQYYYLTDLPLRQVGLLILADSIQPSDNKITFDCMDSLSSKNTYTRDFYFSVFMKIIDKSDGALAEVVGQSLMNFVEKYPTEFAIKSKSITDDQFKYLASNMGHELYFTYDTEKKASSWTNSLIKNCISCDIGQLKRLEEFNKLAIAAMKDADEN